MTPDEARERYERAMHAMQSGVAAKMHIDPAETTPKHLRVGVNSALVDTGAMAQLLISKGVITEDEYLEAICSGAEQEAERYRKYLTRHFGGPEIHLS